MSSRPKDLPPAYVEYLRTLSLEEVAVNAAHQRSSKKRPGTATKSILRWVRQEHLGGNVPMCNQFFRLYEEAWKVEKLKRASGLSQRPVLRPVIGSRPPRSYTRERYSLVPDYV